MKSTAEKFQTKPPDSDMTNNQGSGPLFVVGMWRSGTSLLYALLNQHPEIGLMYEDDLPLLWPLFIGGRAKRDWLARWDFWNSGPERHKFDLAHAPATIPTLKDAMEFAYKSAGTAIWGAKSPNYFDSMTKLAQIFPGARFIIIWRDLRGICSSVTRASQKPTWFARVGMAHRTILGYHEMKVQRDRLVNADLPVHEIYYEDLVSNPAETMQGICKFLQIRFEPSMCSLRNADRSAVFNHEHHALVNSSEIVSSQDRPDVLSVRVKSKIAQYTRLWKEKYAGQWPAYEADPRDHKKPSQIERVMDRLIYRGLRAYDLGIVFIYCYTPMFLLRAYRSSQRQPSVATCEVRKTAESETVSIS
jgi:hypothetical protein